MSPKRTKPSRAAAIILPTWAPSDYAPLIRLWLLRMKHNLKRPMDFERWGKGRETFTFKRFRQVTGLSGATRDSWARLDRQIAEALKREDPGGLLPVPVTPYTACLRKLTDLCGFGELEFQVTILAYLMGFEEDLRFPFLGISGYKRAETQDLVASVLGVEPDSLRTVLAPQGGLLRTGFIHINPHSNDWYDWIDLSDHTREALRTPPEDPLDMLRSALDPCQEPELALADFPHLKDQLQTVKAYLSSAMASGRAGVNVLFYGPPGTGKTELSRVLAKAVGGRLFEVALTDNDGDPKRAYGRLQTFATAQLLLAKSPTSFLLFDEMESSFTATGGEKEDALRGLKAWLNRSLETNPVPTFWITNNVRILDQAFVRRFDLCVEVDIPPRSVRRKILDLHLGKLAIETPLREHLSKKENLAPAVVARAAGVVHALAGHADQQNSGQIFTRVLAGTLRALGDTIDLDTQPESLMPYRVEAVQADVDLIQLLDGLVQHPKGRLCLYGVPGTGKSAFARHVADHLGRPFMAKKASDLLSMWLGATEENMAKMFREAKDEGAVLLLDEADSFLQDRADAKANWEVSIVNEMLTQMESFQGLFIASTNLVDRLDPASLRRFDLKARFDALRPHQTALLVGEALKDRKLRVPKDLVAQVSNLQGFTPGDLAAILRQARFRPLQNAKDLLERLLQELRMKRGNSGRKLGFSAL